MPDVRHLATSIHGRVLIEPAASPAGVLLGFHGYMESAEAQLARLQAIHGSDRCTLVSVQALHRFYRGRSQDVVASWMTRQDRELTIDDNIRYVDAVVADLRRTPEWRGLPVVCVGFSQGGAMAFRAGVRGAFGARGIVCVGADVPPELLADAGAAFPRVLLARGARDEWLTAEAFAADVAALKARGVAVASLVYDAAHEWTSEVADAAGAFVRDTLKSA